MKWKDRTIDEIAEMICIPQGKIDSFFVYRSSSYITRFFRDADTDYVHDGTSRAVWTAGVLVKILEEPHPDAQTPPDTFSRVISVLMDQGDAINEGPDRPRAVKALNTALAREGFEAFYAEDKQCYLRHIGTKKVAGISTNPHRPLLRRCWRIKVLPPAWKSSPVQHCSSAPAPSTSRPRPGVFGPRPVVAR